MDLEKGDFQPSVTRPKTEVPAPLPESFHPFSLAAYPDDFWARLELRNCFKSVESLIKVECIDVDSSQRTTAGKFSSLAELQLYTSQSTTSNHGIRVISICQANSWKPLNVTREMFRSIVGFTAVSPEFLDIALGFYQRDVAVEEAFSSAPLYKCNAESIGHITNDYAEVAYICKYAFFKPNEEGKDPWSLRQTGVYQKYDLKTKSATWIFLHPTNVSVFQTRLNQILKSTEGSRKIQEHPLLLHNILFSSVFPQWREYLAYYERKILSLSNTTMSEQIQETLRVNHKTLTSVRFMENRCLPLRAILPAMEKSLQSIRRANDALLEAGILKSPAKEALSQLLDNYSSHLEAYIQNTSFLQSRAARTAELIADTLTFKNSYSAQSQNDYMLKLTMSTVDDSTTVRVITIVTLIYLPATFTAVRLPLPRKEESPSL
ncbi:hypothetical protein BGW36DRAFT_449225 [Talaromyces proteolyticus]|uniref:CorA-like transporter domain-containing protein n=1 Tax=Talaromyces proteolyticus TaxID=1131652 RepID=A0AAD4KYX9_9EURO|nr:uncharacterized protein BGW36DRAFT_449225 [Talaromyces proteolyticus]KAH8699081.1 hypothetical protein BGW36DRAFT_449225 [Talaromyces proteolyticus]